MSIHEQSAKSSKQTTPTLDIPTNKAEFSKQTTLTFDIPTKKAEISKQTTPTLDDPTYETEISKQTTLDNPTHTMERTRVLLEKRPSITEKVQCDSTEEVYNNN